MEYSTFTCRHCGKDFKVQTARVGKGHDGKYCGRACYHAVRASLTTFKCQQCGAAFQGHSSRPRSFCTRDCYRASVAAERVEKVCVTCGRTFTVKASIAHRYNNCGAECRSADMVECECRRCGKRFMASRNHNRVYCSEKCYRPPQYAECDNCGKRYRLQPKDVGVRRFCTFGCYRRFTGETTLEAKVRAALEELGIPFEQERSVGRYTIDFALLFFGVALEVDGAYWHQNTARDRRKEKALAKVGWRVVRLSEAEIESSRDVTRLVKQRLAVAPG